MTLKYITLLAVGSVTFALFLVYVYRTFRFSKICPVCGNEHPDRVARPKFIKLPPSKAYQCTACRKRFYQLGFFASPSSVNA